MRIPRAIDHRAPITVWGGAQMHDGEGQPMVGVHNVQILRAGRGQRDTDGEGWTYAHLAQPSILHLGRAVISPVTTEPDARRKSR